MCNARTVMDPTGLMFNKKYSKILDPLGVTNTAVGDPTGRWRKERGKLDGEIKAAEAARARPEQLRQQAAAANRNRQILTYQSNEPPNILGGG